MGFWTNDSGEIYVNGSGEPIDCADCPCGIICEDCCAETLPATMCVSLIFDTADWGTDLQTSIQIVNAGGGCAWTRGFGINAVDYVYDGVYILAGVEFQIICQSATEWFVRWRLQVRFGTYPPYGGGADYFCWYTGDMTIPVADVDCSPFSLDTGTINLDIDVTTFPDGRCVTPLAMQFVVTECP